MGSITFTGDRPFELRLEDLPMASASGQIVSLMLPIFVAGRPQDFVTVQMQLSVTQAEHLARQLDSALNQARVAASKGH